MSYLLPPRTVNATTNIIVTMKAPTTVQEVDVPFVHFSPSSIKALWFSINNSPRSQTSLVQKFLIPWRDNTLHLLHCWFISYKSHRMPKKNLREKYKKTPKTTLFYDLAPWSFKGDKVVPQTTKKLHFGHSVS